MAETTASMSAEPTALPPPWRQPLAPDAPPFRALTPFDRHLLDETRGDRPVFLLGLTASRQDVGRWFRRARLFVACLADELLVFAWGPRPCLERYPYREWQGSFLNPITGDLVLARHEALTVARTLRLPPPQARQVLAQILATKEPCFRCSISSSKVVG